MMNPIVINKLDDKCSTADKLDHRKMLFSFLELGLIRKIGSIVHCKISFHGNLLLKYQ